MKNSLETKPRKLTNSTIWQLGDHRLAQGDCRDAKLIKTLLGDERVRLICTDPPYGVAVVEAKRNFRTLLKDKEVANDHLQSDAEYRQFSKEWLEAIVPYLSKKNSAYIFNADKMVWSLRDGMIDAGLKVAQILVWIKQQSVIGRLDYAPSMNSSYTAGTARTTSDAPRTSRFCSTPVLTKANFTRQQSQRD